MASRSPTDTSSAACGYLSSFVSKLVMNRAEVMVPRTRWKWAFLSVAAAFVGSLCTLSFYTQKFPLQRVQASDGNEETSSLGLRELLKKLIHGFVHGSKSTDSPPLSAKEASEIIRLNERRVEVNRGAILYYETNNLASNNPLEDRNSETLLVKTDGAFFGVFDGHGGWQCAETVHKRLPLYVALTLLPRPDLKSLEKNLAKEFRAADFVENFWREENVSSTLKVAKVAVGYSLSQKQEVFHTGPKYLVKNLSEKLQTERLPVDEGLRLAFTQLDDDIATEAIPVKVLDDSFMAGVSGSCAVVSYIEGKDLYVANSGDCRAVLGSVKPDGTWLATPLSHDQTAKSKEEVERVYSEHPGEEQSVIKNGRLLGQLMPLRAFGDVQYKWDKVTHNHILTQVYGGPILPPNLYKTPPYLTAKPVVTHHRLQSGDKFLILASDGLWDVISNEEAVNLVGQFVQDEGEGFERNVATRLIRHAIGGRDHNIVAQMLLVPDQYRRMWRDDITATVVFLNADSTISE